jgi:alkyl sulfatase BDS1-like metallo-beta-lactamase superfamily hydrolase
MSALEEAKPPLASLVLAGNQQTAAEPITDFVFMAKDISNAYLINTVDGDVMVNTGFMDNAERTRSLLAPHRGGPLRYIILTQAHADHYGGVPAMREPQTKIIGGRRFVDTWQYFDELAPFLGRRSHKLWGSTIKRAADAPGPPRVEPDIKVDRRYDFELGGRQFAVISTPGGESLDSVTLWMPEERIAFTGNLFGPVFLAMPNLCTIRGDKPRLVSRYLTSLDTVRQLGAELLVTGHGEPIRGADRIRADLDKMHAAVSYLNRETIAGMNAGKNVHTLMREIRLPAELSIGEFHGKVPWNVRAIWEEYASWFHYDSTTSLYDVPRSSVDVDIVELAGGAQVLARRADEKLQRGQPLEALHLVDIVLGAEPLQPDALKVKRSALQRLLKDCGGTNLSETMWLRSEIAATETELSGAS